MSQWTWIEESVVWAVHEAQLAEHGGLAGVRDAGLLASALARPLNLAAYGDTDAPALAASYGFGIARNHPFIDGNKRTAFVCAELFLALNGFALLAEDAACVSTTLALAGGELLETEFADWLRTHSSPL
jgi:death-on-curing protein